MLVNNNNNIRRIYGVLLEVVLSVSLLVIGCISIDFLVQNKGGYIKYNDYWNGYGDVDVLFCGSSHMMHTALPMELWKKHGIKSYNIANGAEAIPTTYWVLKKRAS